MVLTVKSIGLRDLGGSASNSLIETIDGGNATDAGYPYKIGRPRLADGSDVGGVAVTGAGVGSITAAGDATASSVQYTLGGMRCSAAACVGTPL